MKNTMKQNHRLGYILFIFSNHPTSQSKLGNPYNPRHWRNELTIILGEMVNDLKAEHVQLMEYWSWVNLLKAASCWAQALDDYTEAKASGQDLTKKLDPMEVATAARLYELAQDPLRVAALVASAAGKFIIEACRPYDYGVEATQEIADCLRCLRVFACAIETSHDGTAVCTGLYAGLTRYTNEQQRPEERTQRDTVEALREARQYQITADSI